MRRFYLFRRRSGYYYAEILDPETGRKLTAKSTRSRKRDDALLIVAEWLKTGIPSVRKQIPRSVPIAFTISTILESIRKAPLTPNDAEEIIIALKTRSLVFIPGIQVKKEIIPALGFFQKFWTYDESQYVKEKLLHGQAITRRYCRESLRNIERYWKQFISAMQLQEITRQQIKAWLLHLAEKGFALNSINKAYAAIATPLRWAAKNDIIPVDPTAGIMRFSGKNTRRGILTPEEISKLFQITWPDPRGRVAFAVAVTTGARLGEIRSLRLPDIGKDRLFIRHSWNDDDMLKCPKNGEDREVPLLEPVRDALLELSRQNPYGISNEHFIFHGIQKDKPIAEKYLITWYKEALKTIGIDEDQRKARNLVFHGLRHVYAKTMADRIDARAVMRTTGHRTEAVFQAYADHATENDFQRIGAALADVYSRVIPFEKAAGGES